MAQIAAFATGVPPDIYAFHHYTGNSTILYHLELPSFERPLLVEPGAFTSDLSNRLHALYAQ